MISSKCRVYYVYAHVDAEKNVRYVGKGCGSRAWSFYHRNHIWKEIFRCNKPTVVLLCRDLTEYEALEHESAYIEYFNKIYKLCNISSTVYPGSQPEEIRAKMSAAHKGSHHTEETKTKISVAMKGRKLSLVTRNKMRKVKTEQTRAKMSAAQRGHPVSTEARQKMSEAKKNVSTETRAKISAAKMGNSCHLGKKHSEESRAKISAGVRKHNTNKKINKEDQP